MPEITQTGESKSTKESYELKVRKKNRIEYVLDLFMLQFKTNHCEITITNSCMKRCNPSLRPCHTAHFFLQLQRNSTLKRCKLVTNVWYVKFILANCDGNMYLPILHLPGVELRCKLIEKLHRVIGPLLTKLKLLPKNKRSFEAILVTLDN